MFKNNADPLKLKYIWEIHLGYVLTGLLHFTTVSMFELILSLVFGSSTSFSTDFRFENINTNSSIVESLHGGMQASNSWPYFIVKW